MISEERLGCCFAGSFRLHIGFGGREIHLVDAFGQGRGGFVVAAVGAGEGVLGWNEFASEGFSQQRLREAVGVALRLLRPGLDLAQELEQLVLLCRTIGPHTCFGGDCHLPSMEAAFIGASAI